MSKLIVITFKDKYRAEVVLGTLRRLWKDGLGSMDDAAVVVKEDNGRLRAIQGMDQTVIGAAMTATGSGLGLLVGSLVGLPILGAVAGGAISHWWESDTVKKDFIKRVSQELEPGTSAMFVLGKTSDIDAVLAELGPLLADARLLHADVDDESLRKIHDSITHASFGDMIDPRQPIQRIHVIINPVSGQERPILKPLNAVFHAAGLEWDVRLTKKSGDAQRFAQEAVAAGVDAVAIYGGDGSVMEAASGLLGSAVPLAILPGGTANCMANELGIPYDLRAAAEIITSEQKHIRRVDVGKVGDRYFILRVVTGYEAEFVKGATREIKDRFGRLAYTVAALKQQPQLTRYRLTLDGEQVEVDGYTCIVANSGNYGMGQRSLLSEISVSDGLLDVVVVSQVNFATLFGRTDAQVNTEKQVVQRWQVHEVTVATDQPQTIVGDGEIWDDTPFTAQVVRHAVNIIVR